jgi:hypothetical protein
MMADAHNALCSPTGRCPADDIDTDRLGMSNSRCLIRLTGTAACGRRSDKEAHVKYVVLIYSNPTMWEAMPVAERDRVLGTHNRLIQELTNSGEMLRVDGLAHPINTKTVRLQGGVPVITDGPFSEAKEQLAGVWALECDSIERAIEIAAPVAEYDVVEVRPLMDLSGIEM